MARDVTPDVVRNLEFRTAFRGLDRAEVEATLDVVARRIEELEAESHKMKAQLAEAPSSDMESEFERVGREVSAILQAAREAAESMRERASLDTARWRAEAMEETDTARKEAAADAEALRHDAWVTGTELLEHSAATSEAMRAGAERDVLTVMGEAEREAHRLTSGARRDAEDLIRNANMEAEKVVSDATKRRDEIIDRANREASTAQERTRALELRRDELLEELENVRSTLTSLETSLEERREALEGTAQGPSTIKVVHPPSDAKEQWELGETVRVVPPSGSTPDTGLADEVSDQVARLQQPESEPEMAVQSAAEPEVVVRPELEEPELGEPGHRVPEPHEPEVAAEREPEEPEETAAEETQLERTDQERVDDLEAIFASLRGGGDTVAPPPAEVEELASGPPENADVDDDVDEGTDWIAVRDSRLLPITNRALRGVKKAMTEIQNVALDNLRTEEEWLPDEAAIAESIHAELVSVWTESFAAGHAVAEQMASDKLRRPATPTSNADKDFASDLASSVTTALQNAGDGSRQRQSAASRVFRVWRSDEAERRIRDLAILGYETGIEKSRSVATG